MIYALLAGLGIGFSAGLTYGLFLKGRELPRLLGFLLDSSDKMLTSALFPGLKGVVETEQVDQPTEELFSPEDADTPAVPDWLSDDSPWDYTSEAT